MERPHCGRERPLVRIRRACLPAGFWAVMASCGRMPSCEKVSIPVEHRPVAPSKPLAGSLLSDAEAAVAAEQFIAHNGYTDAPPDRKNLTYESGESGRDVD